MNIDERLEALTQTVELLAAMHKDNDKRLDQLVVAAEKLVRVTARLNERQMQLEEALIKLSEGTARLLGVAEAHEQRISDLEGRRH